MLMTLVRHPCMMSKWSGMFRLDVVLDCILVVALDSLSRQEMTVRVAYTLTPRQPFHDDIVQLRTRRGGPAGARGGPHDEGCPESYS